MGLIEAGVEDVPQGILLRGGGSSAARSAALYVSSMRDGGTNPLLVRCPRGVREGGPLIEPAGGAGLGDPVRGQPLMRPSRG
jgi:hypothetical protein